MPQRQTAPLLVSVAAAGLLAVSLSACSMGSGLALSNAKVQGYAISQDALAQISSGTKPGSGGGRAGLADDRQCLRRGRRLVLRRDQGGPDRVRPVDSPRAYRARDLFRQEQQGRGQGGLFGQGR